MKGTGVDAETSSISSFFGIGPRCLANNTSFDCRTFYLYVRHIKCERRHGVCPCQTSSRRMSVSTYAVTIERRHGVCPLFLSLSRPGSKASDSSMIGGTTDHVCLRVCPVVMVVFREPEWAKGHHLSESGGLHAGARGLVDLLDAGPPGQGTNLESGLQYRARAHNE